MDYVITYDLVGLLLLVLLYVFICLINSAPTRTTRLFRIFIIFSFLGAFFDVFTIWTNKYIDLPGMFVINNILAVIHIWTVNTVAPIYYIFILAITHEMRPIPRTKKIFAVIVYSYDLITIFTSPFTHLIMYFDENGQYLHGPAFVGTYVVIIIFLIAGVIELSIHIKKITIKQYLIVLSYTLIDLISAIYQFTNPEVLLIGFSSAISLMVISFALKNPMELIDNNVGAYNRTAFMEYLFSKKKHNVLAVIHIKNSDAIKYLYGLDNGYSIIRKSIVKILKEAKQKLGFYIFNSTFVYVCKTEEEAREKLKTLMKHRDEPLYIKLEATDTQEHKVYLDSEAFLINEEDLMHYGQSIVSKNNMLDQILDMLLFMVEQTKDSSEVKFIDKHSFEDYRERIRIRKIVDEAIEKEKFEVFLQPIFDLKSKKFTGAESLIRLREDNGKMISPGLFIPEAEKNGKILALGDISIKKTCEFIKNGHLPELGIEKVNINLSMVQCMQENIVEHLVELLNSYEIPTHMIRFEITETITATSPYKLNNVMKRLSSYGIEFALDDYGTGYSNTSRLLEFPFSEIKFDKSFVDSAIENRRNTLPLKHLMNMVSESDMIVLVEGVETKEMSDLIESFGGQLIQGFYYANPLPLADFVEFVKKANSINS